MALSCLAGCCAPTPVSPDRSLLGPHSFTARNFKAAMAFINTVAELAEAETHHPDIHLINYRCGSRPGAVWRFHTLLTGTPHCPLPPGAGM